MMMGCVVERAFKDDYVVTLVRAPQVPGKAHISIAALKICGYFGIYFDYVQS